VKRNDVNELNIHTQAMKYVYEQICNYGFRGLFSGCSRGFHSGLNTRVGTLIVATIYLQLI